MIKNALRFNLRECNFSKFLGGRPLRPPSIGMHASHTMTVHIPATPTSTKMTHLAVHPLFKSLDLPLMANSITQYYALNKLHWPIQVFIALLLHPYHIPSYYLYRQSDNCMLKITCHPSPPPSQLHTINKVAFCKQLSNGITY